MDKTKNHDTKRIKKRCKSDGFPLKKVMKSSDCMPRRGDEANRLGNEYEGLWIADSLLEVLAGNATSITVAGFGAESDGIDLIKEITNGVREFHSLKRQTTNPTWKLKELSNRGVLTELLDKLKLGTNHKAVFVSGTTPNDLNELCERASRCHILSAFQRNLDESPALKNEFEENFLPLCEHNWAIAWNNLQRIRVGGITATELDRRVNQTVRFLVEKRDGTILNPLEARLILTHLALDWLGQPITKSVILESLQENGYTESLLIGNKDLQSLVSRLNHNYIAEIEAQLIGDSQIARDEAKEALAALMAGQKQITIISGSAGLGKSCVFTQALRLLESENVPFLATRLDIQTRARTSQQFGEDLSLPESPCLVLARIAPGSTCILALDQLDALSTVSGRNPHLWGTFGELLREAAAYPNMRILLACRSFDAEHDQRLRKLLDDEKRSLKITLKPLSDEQVIQAICKTGVKPETLRTQQLDILRTPQHLSLYLQCAPDKITTFRDVKELFDRYWETKQNQVGSSVRFTQVIRKLAGWLSNHQTLAAPVDILDDLHADARMMASAHVIVLSEKTWRFFHETFFDYAFARTFVTEGGRLIDLLLSPNQEQHLFRRAQVRQILTYQRDRDFPCYLVEIETLLAEPRVRFHIKKLVLDWLSSIEKPNVLEWRTISRFSNDSHLISRIKTIPHNSPGWFDVLKEEKTWKKWLDSDNQGEVRHAVWLLSLPELNKHRSAEIADLISPYLDGSPTWRAHFAKLIHLAEPHHSRKMFDLFIRTYRDGYYDEADEHWWYFMVQVAEKAPEMTLEFLVEFLNRWCARYSTNAKAVTSQANLELPEQVVQTLEKHNIEKLSKILFPCVTSIIQEHAETARDGSVTDRIWGWRTFGLESDFSNAILGTVSRGIQKLASHSPLDLDRLTEPVEALPHKTIAFLLLQAWSANPKYYADKAAIYLCSNRGNLDIGYTAWSGDGYGPGHVSRTAIRAIGPHCSDSNYLKVENAVLNFEEFGERSKRHGRGYKRLLLLGALPTSRRSRQAQARFEELSRKFPKAKDGALSPVEAGFIDSPIKSDARKRMTDAQWLRAMQKYSQKCHHETYESWRKGGGDGLASALKADAVSNKTRFAALALKMTADLPANFFARLLDGLVETEPTETEHEDSEKAHLLDTKTMAVVFRRIHELPGRPCGKEISWAVMKLANHSLPDDVLAMIGYYAVNDPDPSEELWRASADRSTPYYGGDIESAGLNCVRGAATRTLARLLFRDKSRWEKLKNPILSACHDSSLAVKSMAIECLTAALNVDRDMAVSEFLEISKNSEELLLGCGNAGWFLHYSSISHYPNLRSLLLRMLESEYEDVRKVGANCITIATLHSKAQICDLDKVLHSDSTCRAEAARVFADGLAHESLRSKCRKNLIKLFNDPDKSVRSMTDACFRSLTDEQLSEEVDLVESFINSDAFEDDPVQLCLALKDSNALLPNVVCSLGERTIELHRKNFGEQGFDRFHGNGFYIAELIIRLYQQTAESDIKTRCLNIIDEMLKVGVSSAEKELEKAER